MAEISFDEQRRRRKPAPRSVRPKAKKPKDERTKFDKWLERMREDRSPVEFNFTVTPHQAMEHLLNATCFVIDVDRYMLLLQFPILEGNVRWVAKSIITSAAQADKLGA